MAMTRMQAAEQRAKAHGINIDMIEDFTRNAVRIRGKLEGRVAEYLINRRELLSCPPEHVDVPYSRAYHEIIDALLGGGGGDVTQKRINELERELDKYKGAVKQLSFELEMAQSGGRAVVREDEVRRLALEQAAEHLMDHGVITSGKELVEVCEQIKKLQRHDMKLRPDIELKPWSIVEERMGEVPF